MCLGVCGWGPLCVLAWSANRPGAAIRAIRYFLAKSPCVPRGIRPEGGTSKGLVSPVVGCVKNGGNVVSPDRCGQV